MKKIVLSICSFVSLAAFAQNVGINSTGAAAVNSAALDVDMANKGVLIPRVALTTTTAFAPVTGTATASLLVYNTATAGTSPTNVVPGFYYWDGSQWVRLLGGTSDTYWIVGSSAANVNTPASTGSFGTTSNQHIDLVTAGIVRGRLSNLGEFFIGTTSTTLAGDLMNGVSNTTFPWALNGYSTNNGSGVYGSVQSGTTLFAGVQGEHYGTSTNGAGVRGIDGSATAGTGFNSVRSGVSGDVANAAGTYKFGVFGSGGATTRTGGVMGYDFGVAMGALGYYANNAVDYSVYGFSIGYGTGVVGGKQAAPGKSLNQTSTNIGLGISGGAMGGWIRGEAYGTAVKGDIFSLYVDGKTYTNAPIVQLVTTEADRQPVYSSASMKVEITSRGKGNLTGGTAYIAFDDAFRNVISSNPDELTITVSPTGNSNGVYILSYDQNGFTVKENNNGASDVSFNWIAVGTRRNYESMDHDPTVLSSGFDEKINGVMSSEQSTSPQYMWWDGTQMVFDAAPPAKSTLPYYTPTENATRPKTAPSASPTTGIGQ